MWDSGIAALQRGERVLARKDRQYFLMSECATMTMYAKRNENSAAVHSEKIENPRCRSSSATPAKKRNTSISVTSRTSTTSLAGRVLSSFWKADSARFEGNFATSTRVVHHITASTAFASAAASTASLNACGERLHWLMIKLKMMTRSEYIGLRPFFIEPSRPGRRTPPGPGGVSVSPSRVDVKSHAAVL